MNQKLYQEILAYQPFDEKEANDKEVMLEFIRNNEDVLTRNNRIGHFTTSAWITNKERTKVLMIYHNIYQSWTWVGGHADGDEDLFRVVKKEIAEETGLTNLVPLSNGMCGLNIITVDNHIKRGKQVSSHLHLDIEYLFEANENDAVRVKEDENSGVKWVDIDKVNEYSTEENMKPIYHVLNEKLKRV